MFALILLLAVAESPVEAFQYELSMVARPQRMRSEYLDTKSFQLLFNGVSKKVIGPEETGFFVFALADMTPSGVEVVAKEQHDLANHLSRGEIPSERPNNGFNFELKSVAIPPSGSLPLRVHFKDAVDEFVLRHDKDGLHLEAVKSTFGTVKVGDVPAFKIIRTASEGVDYLCNPFGISAYENGKLKWRTDVRIHQEPDSISVVGDAVYVTTTGGYSLYLLKENGGLLIHHNKLLGGQDPVAETIAAGREAAKLPYGKMPDRILCRYYQTAVELNDRRVIPLLIDSVELGMGIDDKMLAVAALEKFNGKPEAWEPLYKKSRKSLYKSIGMSRVFPDAANKAECDRWRKVFEDELK
jgi:hypothetical protein